LESVEVETEREREREEGKVVVFLDRGLMVGGIVASIFWAAAAAEA
jgi:hypothetical protein